jgi:uncharacterized protein YbjQ (UPF0145 family)
MEALVALLALLPLLGPLLLVAAGGAAGRVAERRHERRLDEREAALAHVTLSDLRRPAPGQHAPGGRLVVGHVVIGCDLGKQVAAQLRGIVGGEVRSLDRVMDRARREALVRLREEADALGARAVINVRMTTSTIGGRTVAAEIICHGTALAA